MILNELSIEGNLKKTEDVNRVVSQFIALCHKISHGFGDRDFYYAKELLEGEWIPGYKIYDWLKDPNTPQREKAFFRMMINRKQIIQKEDFLGSEFVVKVGNGEKREAIGCLAAYEHESYVVSMGTADIWRKEEIIGIYGTLVESEESVQVEENERCIENYVWEGQFHLLEKRQQDKTRQMVSSGKELWEKRGKLYPHLCFCDCVQAQMEGARLSLHVRTIMKRLQVLEDYFKGFDGNFDKDKMGYDCRWESESVEKNSRLRGMRVFKTPYGKMEFFGWHISFSGNFPGRIHFIPDAEHKVGIVGYIGKHLPTARFSTV